MRLTLPILALLLTCGAAVAQTNLGETAFDNSGAAEAQGPFLQGLLLLHSFEYDDAREAFQEARRIDPEFAMAAWGEAMTWNHPVWQRQDRAAALAALDGVTGADATDRERAYLATLAVLFGEGTKEERDDRYADAVRQLAERYPDDLDAQAFYALALLGTAHEGRDFTVYMEAAAVLEDVFAQAPRHPGAAHYLIHAYDDPVHAPLGLRPARVYDRIAPAASHALHMPSHIYLALGMWPEVRDMNRRSFDAARAASDRRGEPLNGHGWHALYWLAYAQMQLGESDEAVQTLQLAETLYDTDPSSTSLHHVVRIRAHVALGVSLRDFVIADALLREAWRDLPREEMDATTEAVDLVGQVHALAFASDSDATAIADRLAALGAEPDAAPAVRVMALMYGPGVLVEGPDRDDSAVVGALREAVRIVDGLPISFGPPTPTMLPHELLLTFVGEEGVSDDEGRCLLERLGERVPGRRVTALFGSSVPPGPSGACDGRAAD